MSSPSGVIRYVVVCECTGKPDVVGWMDDFRSIGGDVSVLEDGLTKTGGVLKARRWRDRAERTIRCRRCWKDAQLSKVTAAAISDLLIASLTELAVISTPDPLIGVKQTRYVVPLGVLCRMLSRIKR